MTNHNEVIMNGLSLARKKLLDLSGRNRLLNFKHTGPKILRFVDESPNYIYAKLMESCENDQKKGFLISPIPLPKKTDYPGIDVNKELQSIDVKEHARFLGISTDFEMDISATLVEEGRHQNDKLQTLHYPEDLDRLVRRIQSEARTAVEESGVNMLFLCLGFLKWKDHGSSDVFYYSPLIMIPVEIQRDKVDARTGFAKFRLQFTGEDILDNICLREKLSQLSISLPAFEEFSDPENYFTALANQLLDIKPDWGVHRYVSIGFLSFGKMLMYLDLDPSKWPGQEGIADAAHIADIFVGNHSDGGSMACEYDIDGDETIKYVTQVMDADSSQHSAIIDVLAGKNLVIEGPPGTGKSQTITNLIAACLEQGKTVLFVAEKLAALQVVKKRLNKVGLGDFCMELHSHKTQKKMILADLKKRLELSKNTFRNVANNIETKLQELNQKKSELIEYTQAINTPFGGFEQTPHQIFWKMEVLQKTLSQPYKPENYGTVKDITKLSLVGMRTHMDAIQNLSDNLQDYFNAGYPRKDHYWHGLNLSGPIEYGDQQGIFSALQVLYNQAVLAQAAIDKLQSYGIDHRALNSHMIEQFEESDFRYVKYFQKINIFEVQTTIDSCIKSLGIYQQHLENYNVELAKYKLNAGQLEKLNIQIVKNIRLPKNVSFNEIRTMCNTLNPIIITFLKGMPLFFEAAGYLDLCNQFELIPVLRAVFKVANFCSNVDKSHLSLRNTVIENAMENIIIKDLPDKVRLLRKKREELGRIFKFDALPSRERLAEISARLQSKNLFRLFSSSWLRARAEYRKLVKDFPKDREVALTKIEILIEYLTENYDFDRHPVYLMLLPSIFKGIDTDIDSLQIAMSFYEKLFLDLLPIPTYGTHLYHCLRSMKPHLYEWFSQNYNSFVKAIQELETALNILGLFEESLQDSHISLIANRIKEFDEEYKKLEAQLNLVAIPSTLSLMQLNDVLDKSKVVISMQMQFLAEKTSQAFDFSEKNEKLDEQLEILRSLASTIKKANKIFPAPAISHILCENGFHTVQIIIGLLNQVKDYQDALKRVSELVPYAKGLGDFWKYDGTDDFDKLNVIIMKLSTLDKERVAFDKWCGILNSYSEAKNLGLEDIIGSFANSQLTVPFFEYTRLYHFLVYHALSNEALRQNKVLGSFTRITHENIRDSFQKIDLELQKLNACKLAREISRRTIPAGNGGRSPKEFTDACLIRHEIGKQKAHIPIRQLVNRAYGALVAMKPCFMMGPLSVAQYIPPHHEKFDILIMDEASQVKPEDAIGVLARAKQVVVVGDSKQLPPTGFFDTLSGDGNDDEEETAIENSESILDVCKPLFQPSRRLRWHYRSQHQSLISFSNNHFYDGDLIIFPSPTSHSDTQGVKHVYVQNGIYTSQSNLIEAKRLVSDIIEKVKQFPSLTYGIVTLNAKQKMVIEDEIERARKDNPIFDYFVSESEKTEEKFFVKNLENVQGDERDVIFISTTFGVDGAGNWKQHFGPINSKDGWRRLNVLFTRAKQHVRIFSSFLPERIKIDDTKEQKGLRALKDYLNFAITGVDSHSYLTGQEPDSDFERAVGIFLKTNGYDVVYQLGVAGYRIDIVVKHPQCPTDYVIAIECDGAAYHSARSARDRDRLREDNLRNLGWTHIHRIWSADWFKRREHEEIRLLKAVASAINEKALVA
ncbi:MAG: DUF4011 domain-containing protein [Gammaproteobacteria bacterium]